MISHFSFTNFVVLSLILHQYYSDINHFYSETISVIGSKTNLSPIKRQYKDKWRLFIMKTISDFAMSTGVVSILESHYSKVLVFVKENLESLLGSTSFFMLQHSTDSLSRCAINARRKEKPSLPKN